LFCLLFNLFPIYGINNVSATDWDWTANLDMLIISTVEQSSIVGSNFTYNFTLENQANSDWTAFRNGFILNLPKNDVSFVSADSSLWNPVRTVINWQRKLYFFETEDFLLKWSSKNYSVNLKSTNSAILLQNYDIKILSYSDDSVYGRGPVPTGAPVSAKDWGIDLANSTNDPTDLTFPDNINSLTNLDNLPFIGSQTKFIPFDIIKLWESDVLIWNEYLTNIQIKWNSLWDLNNFELIDIIPNTRKFTGFTQTGSVWNIQVEYNTPNPWEVKLTMSDIDVAQWTDLNILYKTLALAYPISSYSWSNVLLNTGSYINHKTDSINRLTQQMAWTWNNWVNDIPVDWTTLISTKIFTASLLYAKLWKSVVWPMWTVNDIVQAEIGDLLDYTVTFEVAQNVSFNTNWSWTYIEDILPDGLTFSGTVSSINSWTWSALIYDSSVTDSDWNTKIIWKLNSGQINAWEVLTIKYQAILDWQFEWAWPLSLINLQSLQNEASIFANVWESWNNEEWGYTESSIIDTEISYSSRDWNPAIATIQAPSPINKKYLLSIVEPNWTIYDSSTWMPSGWVAVWSEVEYALVLNFPNVEFSNVKIIDALPLLMWPNTEITWYSFVPKNTKDINNNNVEYNTEDKTSWNFDNTFNSLTLTSTGWITEIPANSIEFDLWSGNWNKIFSIKFKAKILDIKPNSKTNWISSLKNVAFASFNDSVWNITNLDIEKVSLNIWIPELELTKTMSGSNIEAGSNIEYSVEIKNIWKASAYIENLIDTLPINLDLQSYTITGSGFTVNSNSLTQSGNVLAIDFNLDNWRSVLPKNSSVIIDYIVKPNSNLLINNENKISKITLDYFSTKSATNNWLNNYWPLEAETSFITKQPTILRNLLSTSEIWSTWINDVEIWEEWYFETILTLPNWTYENSSFQFTENSNLEFLTGAVLSNSWTISFWSWTTFIWDTVNFWNIINSDLDINTDETIILNSTFRAKITTTNWNKYTQWRFYYNGLNISKDKSIEVKQPNIIISTSLNPINWDAWDILDYTISLNNTWNANAYDLVLKDVLDSKFTFNTWSLVLDWFTWTETEFLSNTWITLDQLDFWNNKTITFQVTVNDNVSPKDIIPNTANIFYSSLDDDNSVFEKNYTWNSLVNFNIDDISINHNIISTSNPDTWSWKFDILLEDISIWEHIFYKTTLIVPESTFSWMVLTQTLPAGFKFLTWSLVDNTLTHSLSNISISNNVITYTLWDISNAWTTWIWNKSIDIFSELILTKSWPTAGQQKGQSDFKATWDGSNKTVSTNLDIVEPNLVIVKDYSISTWDAWDVSDTTITITNNGTAPAYNLSWTDTQNSKFTNWAGYLSSSGSTVLNAWDTITYTYNTTLNNTVTAWDILTWTASVDYSSDSLDIIEEKDYTSSDTDIITVVVSGWISYTLDSSSSIAIWDISTYTIKIPIWEWTTNTLKIEDLLPTWIQIDTWSILVSPSVWITYSWSNSPVITWTWMTWDFTNIINSDTNNAISEYITITFDSLLLDDSVNNISWNTKVHSVKATYNGWNIKNISSPISTIIEPNIVLNITNTFDQVNNKVKYIFSLTNNWTSPAYDFDLSTILANEVTYNGNINITNSGWVVNLIKIWNIFSADSLAVNTWNPLTFEIFADVSENHTLWETLTLTWNLSYDSISGVNTNARDYITSDTSDFIYTNALLERNISVVDDNLWYALWGEDFTYTVTLTNTWNVNLTNIPVSIDIPEYLSWATFQLQSIPGWAVSNFDVNWWINNNWKLDVTWINITVWNSVTIVYKIKSDKNTPDLTDINTVANVWDSPEWAVGGVSNVVLNIKAPVLSSTINIADDNGWLLLPNDIITNKVTIINSGWSDALNSIITLNYDPLKVKYISWSLVFWTWVLIDDLSIVINENTWTITFKITNIDNISSDIITFKTKVIWNIWDEIKINFNLDEEKWFNISWTSNKINIQKQSSRWWSSSFKHMDVCNEIGWDFSWNYYDWKCW